MSTRYVSFSRIADSKGVPVEEVRKAAERGDFGRALHKDGERINAFHAQAVEWMGGEYAPLPKPGRPQERFDAAPINEVSEPEEIQRIADAVVTLTEHGSPEQLQHWARVRKEIAAAATAEARRAQVNGALIPRALVELAVLGYLDALMAGLPGVAQEVAKGLGRDEKASRAVVVDLLGSIIARGREGVLPLLGSAG